MTDKELIKAQQKDIDMLVALVRAKNKELEKLKDSGSFGTDFKFDTPYFRLETNYITCYRLVNLVWHKWFMSQQEPALDLRFSRCFTVDLDRETIINNRGGNQLLKTCISWDALKNRLLRRLKIATNKGDLKEMTHWNNVLKLIKEKTNNCTSFFKEEIE